MKHTTKLFAILLSLMMITSSISVALTAKPIEVPDQVGDDVVIIENPVDALNSQLREMAGGQDTKVIHIQDGQVTDFLMNDKCAAGTGKFIEVMANRLGTDLTDFYVMAEAGTPVSISAMCTVFAESEVIQACIRLNNIRAEQETKIQPLQKEMAVLMHPILSAIKIIRCPYYH